MAEFSRFQRGLWGALGGLVAVGSKYMAQDHYWTRVMMDTRAYDQIPGLIVFYVGLVLVLCFFGVVFAIASKENSEMKLLAIAISAPALITTWLGGARADVKAAQPRSVTEYVMPISSAQAGEVNAKSGANASSGFWEGFKIPLGIGKDDQRYRVIVGSYKDAAAANAKAEQINKIDPTLKAAVGDKRLFNDYYPVVVGDYVVYPAARALKDKAADKLGIDDVYLAPYQF